MLSVEYIWSWNVETIIYWHVIIGYVWSCACVLQWLSARHYWPSVIMIRPDWPWFSMMMWVIDFLIHVEVFRWWWVIHLLIWNIFNSYFPISNLLISDIYFLHSCSVVNLVERTQGSRMIREKTNLSFGVVAVCSSW